MLSAKITIPAVPAGLIPRERLLTRLSQAAGHQVTTILGSAGSGKTVLAAAWAAAGAAPGPIAWLTLDAADNHPATFWRYVASAIQAATREPAGEPEGHDAPARAQLASSLAANERPVILILDRAEVITGSAIRDDLDLLVQYAGRGLRLMLVGRSAPLMPLARYRLAGNLGEVGPDDLAFTLEEATALFRCQTAEAAKVSAAAEAAKAHTAFGGWVTGVCLSALAHRDTPGHAAGARQAVGEYLRREVLDRQPPPVQNLMLRASVARSVPPELAEYLTGQPGARATLTALATEHAFVTCDDDKNFTFATHFQDVLAGELHRRHPELVSWLHNRAIEWLEMAGQPAEALLQASLAGHWASATRLAVTRTGLPWLLAAPDAEPIRAAFGMLPNTETGPAAQLVRAAMASRRFDIAATQDAASRAGSPAGDLAPALALITAVLARLTGQAPPDAPVAPAGQDTTGVRALTQAAAGAALVRAGRAEDGRSALGRAAADRAEGSAYGVHDALGTLSLLHATDGKLHEAEKYATESLAVADRAALDPAARSGAGPLALAWAAHIWDDEYTQRKHLALAAAIPAAHHDPLTSTALGVLRARIAIARRDGRRALDFLTETRAMAEGWQPSTEVIDEIELAAVRAQLILGQPAAAGDCLTRIRGLQPQALGSALLYTAEGKADQAREALAALTQRTAGPAALTEAALLLGRLAISDGDRRSATRELRTALTLARPEQYRRPFAETGPWARQLLRQLPALAAEHRWLFTRAAQARDDSRPPIVETLTGRETEVLAGLAQALSTTDIAEGLFVSANTVKSHLKNIYRKLGTSGRSEAVRRARQLELLPPAATGRH